MVSNNFIEECKKSTYSNRLGRFTIENIEINQSHCLNQMSIKESIYNNGNIFGGIFDKTFEATLIDKPSTLKLEGKKISNIGVGIKYSDSYEEYVNFDNFNIETIKDAETNSFTTITAYGSGAKLEEPYKCTLNFSENISHTVYEFYEDVCNQLGLTPINSAITNGDIVVIGNPFIGGETCRVVLEAIEKVSCNFIDIDWSNKTIILRWFSDTLDYEFNPSDYSTLEGSLLEYGPINVVILGNSQIIGENVTQEDNESIALNGENQIMIDEPFFLYTQELRTQALPAIFNKLNGFKYYDIKLTTPYGKPFLKIGNKIRINTISNKIYDTYIFTHEFIYNGTFKSIIESHALTKAEQEIKNLIDSSSIKNRIRKTEIAVDKVNQRITSEISSTQEISAIVLGNYVLTTDVRYKEDKNYYIRSGLDYILFPQYQEYTGSRDGSPTELNLFEATQTYNYQLSDDTEFKEDINYYTYNEENNTYTLYEGERTGNPSELGLYELIETITNYILTSDTTFLSNKTYYSKNYDIDETIPSNKIYELQGSIYQAIDENNKELEQKINDSSDNVVQQMTQYTDSKISQTESEIELSFNDKFATTGDIENATDGVVQNIKKYLRYTDDGVVELGVEGSDDATSVMQLKNNKMSFNDSQSKQEVAYISDQRMFINEGEIVERLYLGKFAFIPRSNGSLGFRRVK